MRYFEFKNERIKIAPINMSFVLLLAMLIIAPACASNGNPQQKDFDQAVACLEENDALCALEYAKNLPDAEKARIRAIIHFKNQNYDGWQTELTNAINALKKRQTPEAQQLIRHLKKIMQKVDGIQISNKQQPYSAGE